MSENLYPPEYLFNVQPVTDEDSKCFYCLDTIVFADIEYFNAQIPNSENILTFHILCFEMFAWSMFNYFFAYMQNRNQAKKGKVN